MNNSDMPAMPIISDNGERLESSPGLTKRETAAIAAMQGMLSSSHLNGGAGYTGHEISTMAVEAADSLLAALEKS